jgi:hypothetical protein
MMRADPAQRPTAAALASWPASDADDDIDEPEAEQATAQQNWNRLQSIPKGFPAPAPRGDSASSGQGLALEGIFKGRATSANGGKEPKRKAPDLKASKKAPTKQATLTMTKIFQ